DGSGRPRGHRGRHRRPPPHSSAPTHGYKLVSRSADPFQLRSGSANAARLAPPPSPQGQRANLAAASIFLAPRAFAAYCWAERSASVTMCWWSEELCGTVPDAIDLRLGALGELLRKQQKLVAPTGAAPPRQADLSRRTIRLQRSGNERGSHQHARIDREFRQERGAESVIDHLYQGLQTGRLERVAVPATGEMAGGERVLAQAMPVLEQQQILGQVLR